jgi:dolichol kinase
MMIISFPYWQSGFFSAAKKAALVFFEKRTIIPCCVLAFGFCDSFATIGGRNGLELGSNDYRKGNAGMLNI